MASAADAAYIDQVSAQVAEGLARRMAALREQGRDPTTFGSPDEVAAKMLATVPERSPWDKLGPFYTSKGIAATLGGISRQAVEERRRRRTLIALRTADGAWVYPAYQLDDRNRVIAGIPQAWAALTDAYDDEWMAASVMLGRQPDLDDVSIVDHISSGGPIEPVLLMARRIASRLR